MPLTVFTSSGGGCGASKSPPPPSPSPPPPPPSPSPLVHRPPPPSPSPPAGSSPPSLCGDSNIEVDSNTGCPWLFQNCGLCPSCFWDSLKGKCCPIGGDCTNRRALGDDSGRMLSEEPASISSTASGAGVAPILLETKGGHSSRVAPQGMQFREPSRRGVHSHRRSRGRSLAAVETCVPDARSAMVARSAIPSYDELCCSVGEVVAQMAKDIGTQLVQYSVLISALEQGRWSDAARAGTSSMHGQVVCACRYTADSLRRMHPSLDTPTPTHRQWQAYAASPHVWTAPMPNPN